MKTEAYYLPSGEIVEVDASASKGAPTIPFSLADHSLVTAVKVEVPRSLELAILGLAALVNHEAARIQGDCLMYGSPMWDTNTQAIKALEERLFEIEAFRIRPVEAP